MTDEEYLDSWLQQLGVCLTKADHIGRLRLMREMRARPSMTLVATAMEFALIRIDSLEAAIKIAKEIALKAKSAVSVKARTVKVESGATLGPDLSDNKQIEMVPHA